MTCKRPVCDNDNDWQWETMITTCERPTWQQQWQWCARDNETNNTSRNTKYQHAPKSISQQWHSLPPLKVGNSTGFTNPCRLRVSVFMGMDPSTDGWTHSTHHRFSGLSCSECTLLLPYHNYRCSVHSCLLHDAHVMWDITCPSCTTDACHNQYYYSPQLLTTKKNQFGLGKPSATHPCTSTFHTVQPLVPTWHLEQTCSVKDQVFPSAKRKVQGAGGCTTAKRMRVLRCFDNDGNVLSSMEPSVVSSVAPSSSNGTAATTKEEDGANPIAISSSEESKAETSNAELSKFIVTCKLSWSLMWY